MARFGEGLSLNAVSWDLALLVFIAVALFILGITGGKKTVMPFLLSLYVGRTIALLFSQTVSAGTVSGVPWYGVALVFAVSVIFVTWLFAGSSLFSFLRLSAKGLSMWWQVLVAAAVGAGAFASLFYSLLGSRASFSPIVLRLFLRPPLPLLWALAPLVLFLFLRAIEE